MNISATGLSINQLTFISDNLVEVEATAGEILGNFSLIIDNGKSTEVDDAINISEPLIWDFREGMNQSIVKGSRTNLAANDYWLQVTSNGSNWQGSARFLGDNNQFVWNRSEKQSLSWIFFPSGMIGVGSNATDLNSTQQFYQGEILGYFSNTNTFYGFYGNGSNPGSGATQYVNQTLNGSSIIKLTLTNNGEPGGEYQLYDLTPDDTGWQQSGLTREQFLSQKLTTADWFSKENLIKSGEIASNMSADEPEIMPFIALSSSLTLRVLGFYIE